MVGSEVYSTEIKKTEVLMENFRRAIGECRAVGGQLLSSCQEASIAKVLLCICHPAKHSKATAFLRK
jgi:hypothetical protein